MADRLRNREKRVLLSCVSIHLRAWLATGDHKSPSTRT